MQQEENNLKELEALQKFIPFAPSETSYRRGWKGMQAVRYRSIPASSAQFLLRTNRELNLAEVADRAGFADQSHFCLHFKRIVGVTPGQFRISARTS
jgi:AraC-like DNA-binding protein